MTTQIKASIPQASISEKENQDSDLIHRRTLLLFVLGFPRRPIPYVIHNSYDGVVEPTKWAQRYESMIQP